MEAVIFANGPCSSYEKALQIIPRCTLSIAADGGLYHCRNCDLVPDILIGDFDSVSAEMLEDYRRRQCTVLEFPVDKDATDLELAVNTAIERGSSVIHLFGVLGGRWDMSLANILLLSHEKPSRYFIRGNTGLSKERIAGFPSCLYRPGSPGLA